MKNILPVLIVFMLVAWCSQQASLPSEKQEQHATVTTSWNVQAESTNDSDKKPLIEKPQYSVHFSDKEWWYTFTAKDHGFHMLMPGKSQIDYQTDNLLRIQNYNPESKRQSLEPGKYYLQIAVISNDVVCEEQVDGDSSYFGKALWVKGGVDIPLGESQAVCLKYKGKTYSVVAVENVLNESLTQTMLDSLSFD